MITGFSSYGGMPAQQHIDAYNTFYKFLSDTKPSRILEIGTAHGGFILFLRQALNSLDLAATQVVTIDIVEKPQYETLREEKIKVRNINLFNSDYTKLCETALVAEYIQQDGVTIVLCDGGNKRVEFNELAPLIKEGDFIMAHDYCTTSDDFEKNYRNKIWDWCEIEEIDISDVSNKENLVDYNKEQFNKVVWVCKRKLKF